MRGVVELNARLTPCWLVDDCPAEFEVDPETEFECDVESDPVVEVKLPCELIGALMLLGLLCDMEPEIDPEFAVESLPLVEAICAIPAVGTVNKSMIEVAKRRERIFLSISLTP